MKMVSSEDDCEITSVKKKKLKQAQLPFQLQSSVQSPNVIQSKKRKLSSPSVECKSPKTIKILKNLSTDNANNEPDNTDINAENKDIAQMEIIKDAENAKENASNERKSESKRKMPKRILTGQKKLEKLKLSPLTKFLQKTDKQKDSLKEESVPDKQKDSSKEESTPDKQKDETDEQKDSSKEESIPDKQKDETDEQKGSSKEESVPDKQKDKIDKQKDSAQEEEEVSLQEEKNDTVEEIEDNSNEVIEIDVNRPEMTNSLNDTVEDSFSTVNNSLSRSDSDLVTLSSDSEDNDEKTKSITSTLRTANIPGMNKTKQKKLTHKHKEKKLLIAKKREENKLLKMEKRRKLEEERQNRKKEKEEKRKQKEEKERIEREQKLMEKRIKEQKKQMEIEQKQKEKQVKEEERRRKEEEKRKKEEERLEAERKKQKAATTFTSFFVAKKQEKSVENENTSEMKNFMPFEVKGDMKIAPIYRRLLTEQEKLLLDEKYNEGSMQAIDLYLNELKDKKIVPRKSSKTWPLETKDDVILLEEDNDCSSNIVNQNVIVEKHRPKLLQFSENQRPPYWGTWRKNSKIVNPRRPFFKDKEWFNYEIDSDEEWEEEEPGESLRGSDDEKDDENPEDNEYDVDNDFMVPHGYLSDEELRADEEDKEDMNPETQKFKLKLLGEQFEFERNAKTAKLKPKIVGCIWRGRENQFPSNVSQNIVDFLSAREAWVYQIPVSLPTTNDGLTNSNCNTPIKQQAPKKTRFPDAAMPDLIRLLHGNTYSKKYLVKEFIAYWSKKNNGAEKNQLSKISILKKICEIGKWMPCPEEGPMHSKTCWYVNENARKEHVSEELPLPNNWSYVVPLKKKDFTELTSYLTPK